MFTLRQSLPPANRIKNIRDRFAIAQIERAAHAAFKLPLILWKGKLKDRKMPEKCDVPFVYICIGDL